MKEIRKIFLVVVLSLSGYASESSKVVLCPIKKGYPVGLEKKESVPRVSLQEAWEITQNLPRRSGILSVPTTKRIG